MAHFAGTISPPLQLAFLLLTGRSCAETVDAHERTKG
jgi:hypothetical protein